MPATKITSIDVSCQQFECRSFREGEHSLVLEFNSTQKASEVRCPHCGARVHVHDCGTMRLRDIPFWVGVEQSLEVHYHRYRCSQCGRSFSEDVCFRHPGTKITERTAIWVRELLRWHLSISSVHEITGIHWETIRNVHRKMMRETVGERWRELSQSDYRPRYLAVDEFAIHRGHRYATCVMDLVEGDILWVGNGRSLECFDRFFKEFDLSYLSNVEAVAMDMNAPYNKLVEKYLPNAEIVYDRYHMQAQFGREVLGAVRLAEARRHREQSMEISESIREVEDPAERRELRKQARSEMDDYVDLKGSRWTLLTNGENLSEGKSRTLSKILENHESLAVCYAMKEEMCRLFELEDPDEARRGWSDWFDAAESSGIPQLEKFARLKRERLDGLVAHARHRISTGRLEGFNNKIKVAKRIGYGYRDDDYFFTLVRYMSMPAVKMSSPRIP